MTTSRNSKALSLFFIGVSLAVSFYIFYDHPAVGDEKNFHETVKKLAQSEMNWAVLSDPDTYNQATMIPTYSVFLSIMCKIAGNTSLEFVRFFSLLFAVILIVTFFAVQTRLSAMPETSTLQFVFLPILFPLFFVLYTDVPSLCFIVLGAYSLIERRWLMTGLFIGLSVLIRQNNVLWLAYFWLLVLLSGDWPRSREGFAKFLSHTWTFYAACLLFAVFVFYNGGLVLSDRDKHPLTFHMGNIYFALFTFFCVLLPINIAQLPRVIHLLKSKKLLIVPVLAFIVYGVMTFKVDHPYNSPFLKFYLHNNVLKHALSSTAMKTVFFSLAAYAALCLCTIELRERRFYWLYPVAFVFLAASWLIEPRYCLIPLTLFLLFREKSTAKIEVATVLYLIVFALVIFHRINHKLFFI